MPNFALVGSRIVLSPLRPEHGPALASASADGKLYELQWTAVPDETNVASYIQVALDHESQGLALPFVTTIRETQEIIGTTRIFKIDQPNRSAEIGHTWFAQRWQRSFVNTESKYLLLRYAFETMNLMRVQLFTDENNATSRAAILRLGAKEEGTLRKERIMPGGRVRNTVVFSILDEEWPAVRAGLEDKLKAYGEVPSFAIAQISGEKGFPVSL